MRTGMVAGWRSSLIADMEKAVKLPGHSGNAELVLTNPDPQTVMVKNLLRIDPVLGYNSQFSSTGLPAVLGADPSGAAINLGPENTGSNPGCIAAADFNNDGQLDLVTSNQGDNSITVMLGATQSSRRCGDTL